MPALTRSVQNPHLPSVNRKLNAGDPPRFITGEIHGGPGHVPAGPRRLQRYRQASLLTYFLSVLRHEGGIEPSRAKRMATALPLPTPGLRGAAPVTIATSPSSLRCFMSCFSATPGLSSLKVKPLQMRRTRTIARSG